MTDPTPTPTRAGYSVHVEDYADMLRSLSAENQALRERAEAAQKNYLDTRMEVTLLEEAHSTVSGALATALEQLTAARRAEAAAWNDAIDAAGNLESIHGYSNAVPRHRIRALRRAAPTEDR